MRVLEGLMFFPRGGSAHATRELSRALVARGAQVTLLSGSRGAGPGDARRFYAALAPHVVDFDAGDAPMHPSYEDRPGAPDRCFALLDDDEYETHVEAWADALARAGGAEHDVLHLHHLTPLHEAARRVAPGVPVVTQLHGTELLLLEAIEEGGHAWPHADAWARRLGEWARASARIVLPGESQLRRAERLLGVDPGRCVVLTGGVDVEHFRPLEVDRGALWRRLLVDEPRGWRPGGDAGSVRYAAGEVAHLATEPVVVGVGRYTLVKRVDVLIRAFARARHALPGRPSLVLVGGHPGEWEGWHPLEVVEATGARDVFLAGWHDHDELPQILAAADLLALASVREQFGLVLVEAMACCRPVVAVDRYGPAEIVAPGETGWLVPPDDEAALAGALHAALADPDERARRGRAGRRVTLERYSWPAVAAALEEVLAAAAAERHGSPLP